MNNKYPNLVGSPLDYSKDNNWLVKQDKGYPVDVFYLYPTTANPKSTQEVANIDDSIMIDGAKTNYERGASCLESIANMYAPLYRQLTVATIIKSKTAQGLFDKVYNSIVRTDTYAALDYFFQHINKNKPFILASHSQGSVAMYHILKEYMTLHPEHYSRMICAYVIGMSVNKQFISGADHIKFAKGETDTGVIISWNTEGPEAVGDNITVFKDAIGVINPLNWKTDDTYAPISLNKGSYDLKQHKVVEGVADAQISLKRKSLITTTVGEKGYKPLPKEWVAFGEQSYHHDDWNLFYMNIKENATKRVEEYFKEKK